MLFLQPRDYMIEESKLCIKADGFVLVFYTADFCTICKTISPHYNKLAKTIKGCTFAYMDVQQENMKLRKIAAQVGGSFDYVPMFILYSNKVPIAVYNLKENDPNFPESFQADLKAWLVSTTTSFMYAMKGPPKQAKCATMPSASAPASMHGKTGHSEGRPKPTERSNPSYKTYGGAYSE